MKSWQKSMDGPPVAASQAITIYSFSRNHSSDTRSRTKFGVASVNVLQHLGLIIYVCNMEAFTRNLLEIE